MNKITALFKLEELPREIKEKFSIRSKSRLDCTMYSGTYEGLEPLKNKKGQLFFYKTPAHSFVKSESVRMAEWALTTSSINLSSLYFEDTDYPCYCYGYPNSHRQLNNGQVNPIFSFSQDAFLFIVNEDRSTIELMVIRGGRNLVNYHYQALIDGDYDQEIKNLRENLKPYWPYGL